MFFRYEKHQKGRGREFYQFNCDILGEDSVLADAELIALAIDLMRELGFSEDDFRIRVSDRSAWVDFASRNGVEGEDVTTFLQAIDKMERTPVEKVEEQLAAFGLRFRAFSKIFRHEEWTNLSRLILASCEVSPTTQVQFSKCLIWARGCGPSPAAGDTIS